MSVFQDNDGNNCMQIYKVYTDYLAVREGMSSESDAPVMINGDCTIAGTTTVNVLTGPLLTNHLGQVKTGSYISHVVLCNDATPTNLQQTTKTWATDNATLDLLTVTRNFETGTYIPISFTKSKPSQGSDSDIFFGTNTKTSALKLYFKSKGVYEITASIILRQASGVSTQCFATQFYRKATNDSKIRGISVGYVAGSYITLSHTGFFEVATATTGTMDAITVDGDYIYFGVSSSNEGGATYIQGITFHINQISAETS